jgi:hypothetical protein
MPNTPAELPGNLSVGNLKNAASPGKRRGSFPEML